MTETDVERLLKALHLEEVEFVIIGGVAAVLQGSAYVTADLDICYSRKKENLEKLSRALASFHPSLRAVPEQVPFHLDVSALRSGMNFTLRTDAGDVDILGEVTGMGNYEQVVTFAEAMEMFGVSCKVLTLEGLIKAKRAVGRAKDLRLLPELEALVEIRKTEKKN
ncbi:MAG: nucleotidyltransferase [Candidatus Binatia bacterium]